MVTADPGTMCRYVLHLGVVQYIDEEATMRIDSPTLVVPLPNSLFRDFNTNSEWASITLGDPCVVSGRGSRGRSQPAAVYRSCEAPSPGGSECR